MKQINICICKNNKCLPADEHCQENNGGVLYRAIIIEEIRMVVPHPPSENIIAETHDCWWVKTEPNTAIRLPKRIPKRGDLIMVKREINWKPVLFKCFTRNGEAAIGLGSTQWYTEWRFPTTKDLEFIYETNSE